MAHKLIAKNMIKNVTTGEIRLIGVGVEELGAEEFVSENFFTGVLFIDIDKKCYKDLNYRRYNALTVIKDIVGSSGRQGIREAREAGISGNFKGDGFQNGGTLVVSAKGEKCLLEYKQINAAEHVKVSDILEALNINK